jgi:hypothetical protein
MAVALTKSSGLPLGHLRSTFVYGALLPLFMLSEGVERLGARLQAQDEETTPTRETWFERARSQASIATSYALTARRLLQLSERRARPERLS